MEDNENINKDPDVSPTSSWVFVEKSAVNNESGPSSGDHVINESRIQELIEDDLGGSSSCDSDGISVISETECYKNHCCEGVCTPNTSEEDEEYLSRVYNTECCENGCDDTSEDVLSNTSEDVLPSTSEDETEYVHRPNKTECPFSDCYHHDNTYGEMFANTYLALILPKNWERNNTAITDKTNTTITDKINNNAFTFASAVAGVCIFITYLMLSNYDTAPATYHQTEVTIDDFDDMFLWNYDDNDTCDFNILREINTDISSFMPPQSDAIKASKLPANTINQNANKENYANKQDKHISRNSNNIKKSKTKHYPDNSGKNQKDHLKQQENYLKKKEKYLTKREKHLKKLEKHIVTMESRFRKFFVKMKHIHQQFEDKSTKIKKSKINGTAAGGEWYEKMSFGRSEIRHREKLSDWMFERSKMRNKLRNKAHWYFNRANGREEIRSSENDLRSGKRNHFKTYRY